MAGIKWGGKGKKKGEEKRGAEERKGSACYKNPLLFVFLFGLANPAISNTLLRTVKIAMFIKSYGRYKSRLSFQIPANENKKKNWL